MERAHVMSTYLINQSAFETSKLGATACPASSRTQEVPNLLRRTWAWLESLHQRVETWRASRQLLGADEGLLKDIGVPRCGVEWSVRNGRSERRSASSERFDTAKTHSGQSPGAEESF
jgi:hypothetical protein